MRISRITRKFSRAAPSPTPGLTTLGPSPPRVTCGSFFDRSDVEHSLTLARPSLEGRGHLSAVGLRLYRDLTRFDGAFGQAPREQVLPGNLLAARREHAGAGLRIATQVREPATVKNSDRPPLVPRERRSGSAGPPRNPKLSRNSRRRRLAVRRDKVDDPLLDLG